MIAPIEPEPIKGWKGFFIRYGIPLAILGTLTYFLLPYTIEHMFDCVKIGVCE